MKYSVLAFAMGLTACASTPGATASNPLIGSWELIQYVDTPEGGAPVHAFGDPPVGLFVFTADGRVSISFMRNPPRPEDASIDKDPDACIPMWYCSYFGTYTPDQGGGRVDGPCRGREHPELYRTGSASRLRAVGRYDDDRRVLCRRWRDLLCKTRST